MGIDWEKPFRKYLAKKFKENLGIELPPDAIDSITMDFEFGDIANMDVRDLGVLYTLTVMTENFEKTQQIVEEFKSRGMKLNINVDEKKNSGILDITSEESPDDDIHINLIVTNEGMMIDWEKENL